MFFCRIFFVIFVAIVFHTNLWGVQNPSAAIDKLNLPPNYNSLINKLQVPYEKYQLKNGLTVILSPNKNHLVTVNLWYKVGSIHEDLDKSGFAHFFEHNQFEGSAHIGQNQFVQILQKAGATNMNAYTRFGNTAYYQTVPPWYLEWVLWLESSRMSFPHITQAKIDEQREVVRRELDQRYGTSPYGAVTRKFWNKTFHYGHPFHGSVIGFHKDLQSATVKDFQNFFDRYYGPTNAVLTIVGGFNREKTKNLINKYFSTLPKVKPVIDPIFPKIAFKKQEIIRMDEKISKLSLIKINYITPKLFAFGDADLDIIGDILTGKIGRLTRLLKHDQQLVSSINAYQRSMKQLSIFSFDAILNSQTKPEVVIAKIDQVLEDLVKNPPTIQEINRARNQLLTNLIFSLQKDDGYSGKAEIFQRNNFNTGNPGFLYQDVKRYLNITPESLAKTASIYLPPKTNRKILIATPVANKINQTGN